MQNEPLYEIARLQFATSRQNPRDLLSFPTRRSSDLCESPHSPRTGPNMLRPMIVAPIPSNISETTRRFTRSEEHTSELQSRVDLVCRLLLEKKKRDSIREGYHSVHDRTPAFASPGMG